MKNNIGTLSIQKKIVLDENSLKQFNVEDLFAGKSPRVYTKAFGCLQSADDAQRLTGIAIAMGYLPTEEVEKADLIIINTCAVRENAEDRLFGNIGALKHLKADNPNLVIVVAGCSPEQESIRKKLLKSYHHVDIVLGSNPFTVFAQAVFNRLNGGSRYFIDSNIMKPQEIVENLPTYRENTVSVSIPIMYGCNKFCTYCIVPFVRGRERSRDIEDIVAEARAAIANGAKEITVIGQNVNSYNSSTNFAGLLERLDKIDGEFIIRFMSSHPRDFTRELVDTIARCPHIERHLHLPLQSGSDSILKDMRRSYTTDEFIDLINYYREKLPESTLSTDIIVGFPSETYDDFVKTLDILKKIRFDNVYSFIYSKRSGTPAAKLPDITEYSTKSAWHRQLLEVQGEIADQLMGAYVGRQLRVLVEKSDDSSAYGKNSGAIAVKIDSGCKVGEFVDVTINSAARTVLHGSVTT